MWLFRRRWHHLDAPQQATLTDLFERLPALGEVYHRREELAAIFDTAPTRAAAEPLLHEWCAQARASDWDWGPFLTCLENHWDGILAYFDGHKTSGVVEGLNNKARVVLKRCYGLKGVDTFWTRLLVEAGQWLQHCQRTIADLRLLAHALRASFCLDYT
jgi:transposase